MINVLLAALSGILLVIIHPRLNFTVLAPFALTPLLIAVAREGRPKVRFLLGYMTGALFWGGLCYWIRYVIDVHGQLGTPASIAVFPLFCFGCAVNIAFFATLAGTVMRKPYAAPAIAALWVGFERIRLALGRRSCGGSRHYVLGGPA